MNVQFPVDGLFRKDEEVWPCWSDVGEAHMCVPCTDTDTYIKIRGTLKQK